MNGSLVLAARDEIPQRVGSKSFTSPAKWVAKAEWSKCVMGPMAERTARTPCQVSSVPQAIGVTRPIPVTTTLRPLIVWANQSAVDDLVAWACARLLPRSARFALFGVRLDVVDRVSDGLDLL